MSPNFPCRSLGSHTPCVMIRINFQCDTEKQDSRHTYKELSISKLMTGSVCDGLFLALGCRYYVNTCLKFLSFWVSSNDELQPGTVNQIAHFSPSDFCQDILSQQQVKNAKHPERPVTHIWSYQASGPYFCYLTFTICPF